VLKRIAVHLGFGIATNFKGDYNPYSILSVICLPKNAQTAINRDCYKLLLSLHTHIKPKKLLGGV